jgi:hypothetical protein
MVGSNSDIPLTPGTIVNEAGLRSRRIRILNSADPLGIRRINPVRDTTIVNTGTSGLSWVLKKLSSYVGFAFKAIVRAFPFSVSSIFGMLVQAYFLIKTFDWNQRDTAIEARIKQNNKTVKDGLAPVIGQYLGYGVVRLASFAIGGTLSRISGSNQRVANKVNIPVVQSRIGLELAEEANDEIRGSVLGWLYTVRNAVQDNLFLSFILTARNNHWFGWEPIKSDLPNASFAEKIEDKVEALPTDWENFAEELLEEFEEAIIEAGYVLAYEIDDYYLAMKAAQKAVSTDENVVDVSFTAE